MKLLKEAHIDIVTLNVLSEHFEMERTQFQGISLDYRRFNSESILACYQMEYDAIKRVTPNIPITTNLMGFYKGLDYKMWAKSMDFISWDNYPSRTDDIAQTAMSHDLMRGIKGGIYDGKLYKAELIADIGHLEHASAEAVYREDFYVGAPVVTVNIYGKGKAYYVATRSEEAFYKQLMANIIKGCDIKPLVPPQKDLEVTLRCNEKGSFLFLLNHGEAACEVEVPTDCKEIITSEVLTEATKLLVQPKDVKILMSC